MAMGARRERVNDKNESDPGPPISNCRTCRSHLKMNRPPELEQRLRDSREFAIDPLIEGPIKVKCLYRCDRLGIQWRCF
jgi:hypothetical protein